VKTIINNVNQEGENTFQRWANDYARAFGFIVTLQGNWVKIHKDGESQDCLSVSGMQAACGKYTNLTKKESTQ